MAPKPKTSRQLADKVPIQAVVRAFSVLEALATRPTGVRLADLSRMVGLHKATVYRLVRTMVLLGYVTQTADGEPYRISGQLIAGGLAQLRAPQPRHARHRSARN